MKIYKILTICLLSFPLNFWQFVPELSRQHTKAQTESQQLPWDKLYQKEPPRNENSGGSRSASIELCTISPQSLSGEEIKIWSSHFLFIWQGNISKIEIRKRRSTEVLWRQKIASNQNSIIYNGPLLESGESYDWVIFEANSILPTFQVLFQVISTDERDKITADLKQLELQLKQEKATPEKIAYAKANYFAERQMWPDVLRFAYEVKNPSQTLNKFITNISKQFCNS